MVVSSGVGTYIAEEQSMDGMCWSWIEGGRVVQRGSYDILILRYVRRPVCLRQPYKVPS